MSANILAVNGKLKKMQRKVPFNVYPQRSLRCVSVNILAVSGKLKKLQRNTRLNIYPDDSLWINIQT